MSWSREKRAAPRRLRRLMAEALEPRTVLAAPVAVDDSLEAVQDTPLLLEAAALFANDSDPDGDTLAAALALGSGPYAGTLTIQDQDTLLYKPALGYYGDDYFRYFVSDGTNFSQQSALVHIVVKQLPPAGGGSSGGVIIWDGFPGSFGPCSASFSVIPLVPPSAATGRDCYETTEDTPLVVALPGVLANDFSRNSPIVELHVKTQPSHGSVSLAADGSFTYTPAQDYFGIDQFGYEWTNGEDVSLSESVFITITPVNDPPVVADDKLTVESGIPLKISINDLRANDRDVDSDVVTVAVPLGTAPLYGSLALSDTILIYTPDMGYVGSDHFTYVATDGELFSAWAATASITLSPPVRRNIALPTDVNSDGAVAAGDALMIINYLNAFGSKSIAIAAQNSRDLLDVNGDGSVAASDALAVINELNAKNPASLSAAEHSAQSTAAIDAALAESDAYYLSLFSEAPPARRRS